MTFTLTRQMVDGAVWDRSVFPSGPVERAKIMGRVVFRRANWTHRLHVGPWRYCYLVRPLGTRAARGMGYCWRDIEVSQ